MRITTRPVGFRKPALRHLVGNHRSLVASASHALLPAHDETAMHATAGARKSNGSEAW